ncbi:Hypothetical predicted protein [Mytilus galloprovincialis]|uniref:DZIP3-like HEPN domain-containing protein n=1 Tax=Mytilus galloprovincialis TaxID=29158 RepID=A0A8B6C1K0_MYTGA|nr:Hypothetical predicted protein [Mytilus galloprovincialis]
MMSFIGNIWHYICNWWYSTDTKYDVYIDQYPNEKVHIGHGGSIKLLASVRTSSPESFIKWQKIEDNKPTNLLTHSMKYHGSSCSMPRPELVINDVDKTDARVYQLSVTTVNGTVTGPHIQLEVFGEPVYSLSKEKNNFLRYFLLCQTIATESVRLYFIKTVPEPFLATHLNSHMKNLRFSYWKCSSDQLAVLFPGAPVNVKSTDFDFSLLYKLTRNTLTTLSAPTSGWGSQPLPGDITKEDDIERIRHSRNLLAHNTEFRLNDSDFNNMWTDLSQAIIRLSCGTLSADVSNLLHRKLDQQLQKEIFENLQREIENNKGEINILHQDLFECREAIVQHQERIQKIEDDQIPSNIRQTHLKVLNQWKEDDEVYYDGTNVYKAAKDTIQSCSVIVLVGGPGCGKTAMARHLALKYYQYGWEVVPVCRVEEISQYADVKLKQIFVLDNIFGKFTVDIFMYSTVNNHKDSIMNAMNKDSKLFFTCRKSVYKEAVKLNSFVLETVIDLESKENTLNDDEKENILTKHCRYTGVPEKIFTNLLFSTSHIMFPLLCKVFTTKHEIHGSMERFLANPYRCLILELDKLECISPHQYAALILCLLSNNMLSTNKTLDDKMKLDAYNTCGVNLGTSDKQIRNALTYLVGTYFVECKNDLTFIHDAIYEIVAYHYGRTRPHIILKYMKSNFIATKVTVHMDQGLYSNSDLLIVIDKCHYEQMAERLYTDLKSLELFDVFINKSLSYPPFLDVFIETLTKKPYKELQTLLFLEQNESKIKHRCFDEKIEKKDKQEEQMRLELLSSVIYDKELNKTYSIRVISWIIYYGHTSLLQTSVDLVLKNHESTNMIFGSDITEQTRLLTLGCYSGNPDMVNTILKYVNGNCINRTSQNGNMRSSNLHRSRSPLTAACYSGHLSVVQVLLLNNAKINQCDNYGRFPLHIASCKGHYDVIKCLVQNGADVNQCDKINNSPLYTASESGYYDVVEYLVQNGANVNQCDDFNISPLYKASEVGHYDVVKYLVKNGANINQCNSANETPLFATVQMGHYNIVNSLILRTVCPRHWIVSTKSASQITLHLSVLVRLLVGNCIPKVADLVRWNCYWSKSAAGRVWRTELTNIIQKKHSLCEDIIQIQRTNFMLAVPASVKSSNFDITLLYKLIRNTIKPLSPPTRGWSSQPLPGDLTEEDDLERIRFNRNILAHNTELKLTDSDFNKFWTDLSKAIVRLSIGSLSVDVSNILKQKLDQQIKNEILESYQKDVDTVKSEMNILHLNMFDCKEAIVQHHEKIKKIEDHHIPSNIRRK